MENGLIIEEVFAPGSKVVVEYIDPKGLIKNHITKIEELEGLYIILQTPIVKDLPVPFRESQELTLRRLDSQKDEAYVTNVFVIDIKQGRIPLLVCSKPHKIDRTSLRRFARFGVDLPLKCTPAAKMEKCSVRDISLSGCYIKASAESGISGDRDINLIITLPGEGELAVKGKIIREDPPDNDHEIGLAIEFINVTDSIREALYSYIFQVQLTGDTILGRPHRLE